MSVREITELGKWLRGVPRHRGLTHGVNESDSEILPFSALGRGRYLATTVDSVSEEIAYGLYEDPRTMGWVCATASLSDLAAVGARPEGFLFSATWGPKFGVKEKRGVAAGLGAALRAAKTGLLGGDTGQGASTVLTGVGLGVCDGRPLSRVGLRPGDFICTTGPVGRGPAWGFRRLLGDPKRVLRERDYRPCARVGEGMRLRALATAAIDTSDGLASALATLCELNGVAVQLRWDDIPLDAKALRFCRALSLPPASLLFGEHGDFELVCGVRGEPALKRALALVPGLRVIGRAVRAKGGSRIITSATGRSRPVALDLVAAADKSTLARIERVFREMISYCAKLGL